MVTPVEANILCLDCDSTFTLDIHRVEILRTHLASADRTRDLEKTVGEGALAMIDMGNDAEAAQTVKGGHPGSLARNGPNRGTSDLIAT